MATGAVRFIQRGFHSIMFIEEIMAVIYRFQRRNVVVALFAGKRRIDFVVANQAIGHQREQARRRDILRLLDTVMAAGATVGGAKMRRDSSVQVLFGGDSSPQNRRDIAKLNVRLVVKTVNNAHFWRLYDTFFGMTGRANRFRRQAHDRSSGLVASRANQFQCQMPPVRKRCVLRPGGTGQKYG